MINMTMTNSSFKNIWNIDRVSPFDDDSKAIIGYFKNYLGTLDIGGTYVDDSLSNTFEGIVGMFNTKTISNYNWIVTNPDY